MKDEIKSDNQKDKVNFVFFKNKDNWDQSKIKVKSFGKKRDDKFIETLDMLICDEL